MTSSSTFPVSRAGDLPIGGATEQWLVRPLWARSAVGFLFGAPKSAKTWFGLELAVSVASGAPCLGRYPVEDPGPVLAYLAEDPLHHVRARIAALCEYRGLTLARLRMHVITEPCLRLDIPEHLQRLRATIARLRPRLLLLDPFVRLHRRSENDVHEISGILGDLRQLQREFDLAITVVHHARKRSAQSPGEALRGSSDLYAWVDSAAHLAKLENGHRRLTIEHRSALSPDPILLELASRDDGTCTHLQVLGRAIEKQKRPVQTLAARIIETLEAKGDPITSQDLRKELKVRNEKLKTVLDDLVEQNAVVRVGRAGWVVTEREPVQASLPFS